MMTIEEIRAKYPGLGFSCESQARGGPWYAFAWADNAEKLDPEGILVASHQISGVANTEALAIARLDARLDLWRAAFAKEADDATPDTGD